MIVLNMCMICLFIVLFLSATFAQEEEPNISFPDVFQMEVQGIFQSSDSRPRELDGSLYYDKVKNRAVLVYTYQKQKSRSIYNFDDNQILSIEGSECTINDIPDKSTDSFFPFVDVKNSNEKKLAKPEDIFHFSNATWEKETQTVFPSYIYKSKLDFPQYGRKNCDVMHIFSRPELELPTCDSMSCKPTLLSISVKCGSPDMVHIYNFFRFRSGSVDERVFQAPAGVHCPAVSHRNIPDFPGSYSFSYDITERQMDNNDSTAAYAMHKKVWFDIEFKVIRLDEFDEDGLKTATRIFDFFRGNAFTITALGSVASCEMGSIGMNLRWDQMTRLPNVFFMSKASEQSTAVYVGKRDIYGFDYEVWSSSTTDKETDAVIVEELYYTNNIASVLNESFKVLQISHSDVYIYERNDDTDEFELSILNHLSINHFRSKPREWEAYDVAPCFSGDQKKSFRLFVEGPPVIKESQLYEDILELLYMNLYKATKVSVVRISELTGIFDGIDLKEFVGLLLDKVPASDSENSEPTMEEAYNAIQKAAESNELSVTINQDGNDLRFKISGTEDEPKNETKVDLPKPTFPDVFRVEVQGIIKGQDGDPPSELEGTIFYDKVKNRAASKFVYQNQTTSTIYYFDEDEFLSIEGRKCSVTKISEDANSFFPIAKSKQGKMALVSPEELFYFSDSELDRQDISISPYYIYEGTIDLPQYGLVNCDVSHVFTKPEVELPDCEGHACKPTLVTISLKCAATDESGELSQVLSFFRFSGSLAETPFQAPVGVHCALGSRKPFPMLPGYFSFSYDLIKEQETSGHDSGVYALHKKIWYESKVNVIRIDEMDDDGLLTTTRIFDFYGEAAYTLISTLSACEAMPSSKEEGMDQLTRLPKIFFSHAIEDLKSAVYIGKRNIRGLDFDVWSILTDDEDTYTYTVEEIYFTRNIPSNLEGDKEFYYQISHADSYTYVRNEDTRNFDLSLLTHLSISNFRSKHKEWESFDISLCFKKDQRKGFKLKIDGPTIIKESHHYHDILEHLLMKLINVSSINILRINELQGSFDGAEVTEFVGWILDKPDIDGANQKAEVDTNEAYNRIEKAALSGELTITVRKDDKEEIQYKFPSIQSMTGNDLNEGGKRNGYSGASMSGMGLACLSLGFIIGIVGYYVFLKKRRKNQLEEKTLLGRVELTNM